jgi:hypothetical protein
MGGIGGSNADARAVFALRDELLPLLHEALRPNDYGDGLDAFYLSLHVPALGVSGKAGLQLGSSRPAQAAFSCTLTFPESFGTWRRSRQRAFFIDAIETAAEALGPKLRKKAPGYDFAAFRADLAAALARWAARGD